MPKYRLLTLEELQELEKEFVEYLVLNGITADDWEKIKKENPSSARHIIEFFSDVVFESIMRKVKYLELRTAHEVKVFQCLESKLVLVAMQSTVDPDIDFTNTAYIKNAMNNPPPGLKVYTSEKTYGKVREIEIFEMIRAGALITGDQLFKSLCLALPSQ